MHRMPKRITRSLFAVCAGCGDYRWCHWRKVGGQLPVLVCNRCTRSERRWLRQHPNTAHRALTDHSADARRTPA